MTDEADNVAPDGNDAPVDKGSDGGGDAASPSSPPPPPAPSDAPKAPSVNATENELAKAIREQNDLMKQSLEVQKDTAEKTRAVHEALFAEDDDAPKGDQRPEVTVVEPTPPPQPHAPEPGSETPAAKKKGWKRFY